MTIWQVVFRYCTDERWTQPNYEKMLSDNALLLTTFSQAYRSNPKANFRQVISDTISWLNREMGNHENGYASSLSAETNGEEGASYGCTLDEMVSILGKQDANKFFFSLPETANKHHRRLPQLLDEDESSLDEQLHFISLLREGREKRPHPPEDQKRLLAHNSLVLSAFVQASLALNDITLLQSAIKLEEWITNGLIDKDHNLQSFIYPGKTTRSQANLDDYCFLV